MSELAVALLLAALIAPPSAPDANGRQPVAATQTSVTANRPTSAPGFETAAPEPQRKGKCARETAQDIKCPAAVSAPVAAK